ncbi:cyclase [Mycobacterium kubicae]|uniref:Cyclase n=1 Tax=Mycobacterium kubicae TaxID=120959 RepID=A0AAX1JGL9_9MYCO|nr:SRPBCC family protein [Mycobacterium kubicae]MCV7095987.1 SRPBCC family protein [Mycobacterium kubicae]OBF23710.1 cyclase [Mycobacterium kubicae]OBK55520.1 cyclase [Mycobacterium kubicae]ORV99326.1 cyclase [Mycobacterium kubicae]QNI12152.1 SRPBCC family protein [Mycobacterium kubicae]
MQGSVTVHMSAPAQEIWELIADIRNTGRFSPETFEAEWLGDATGPALGARFRGHVRRNEVGPVYWSLCEVTACDPPREFGFAVFLGERPVNNWHYRLVPAGDGTDVTESFRLNNAPWVPIYWLLGGFLRKRRNLRDMTKTLHRIKDVVEAS